MTEKIEKPDWHVAFIKFKLSTVAGKSLRQLSIENNLSDGTLKSVLRRPYPRAQKIVAEAIGVSAATIWPSRYHEDGSPKRGRQADDKRKKAHNNSTIKCEGDK